MTHRSERQRRRGHVPLSTHVPLTPCAGQSHNHGFLLQGQTLTLQGISSKVSPAENGAADWLGEVPITKTASYWGLKISHPSPSAKVHLLNDRLFSLYSLDLQGLVFFNSTLWTRKHFFGLVNDETFIGFLKLSPEKPASVSALV